MPLHNHPLSLSSTTNIITLTSAPSRRAQLGKEFREVESVVIAKMDATANDPPENAGVRGFPTLKFYKSGTANKEPIDFDGERTGSRPAFVVFVVFLCLRVFACLCVLCVVWLRVAVPLCPRLGVLWRLLTGRAARGQ
eukprot:219284-Rhodomonas_salina.1